MSPPVGDNGLKILQESGTYLQEASLAILKPSMIFGRCMIISTIFTIRPISIKFLTDPCPI